MYLLVSQKKDHKNILTSKSDIVSIYIFIGNSQNSVFVILTLPINQFHSNLQYLKRKLLLYGHSKVQKEKVFFDKGNFCVSLNSYRTSLWVFALKHIPGP